MRLPPVSSYLRPLLLIALATVSPLKGLAQNTPSSRLNPAERLNRRTSLSKTHFSPAASPQLPASAYHGGSYGGADVTAYATRFGEHLRSIVLDAPFGTTALSSFTMSSFGPTHC